MEGSGKKTKKERVCVTGAGGFVSSWLVKLLLSRGHYMVHGTVRDPSDAKNAHLKALDGATENLHLFKADLLDYTSMVSAIAGCEGVFHVASPVLASSTPNPEVELLAPAVTGTQNVLKACSEAKVKRVILVSSVSAVMVNPKWPEGKVMDEDCWSDVEHCKSTQNWYCLSKTLAEREAFYYAKKTGLDIVTVCPSLVIGPLLQSTVNASNSVVVDYLKGDSETVKAKLRNFVDVRDVADALLLVYENPEASGRYICHSHSCKVSDIVDILKRFYPNYNYPKCFVEVNDEPLFSSKKLHTLGWKIRPLEETLKDCVESYRAACALN